MSLNRRNPSRDGNEKAIRDALHKLGCRTWPLSGPGIPDLLCSKGSVFFVVEVKTPSGRLTGPQEAFFDEARYSQLPAFIIRSTAECGSVVRTVGDWPRNTGQKLR